MAPPIFNMQSVIFVFFTNVYISIHLTTEPFATLLQVVLLSFDSEETVVLLDDVTIMASSLMIEIYPAFVDGRVTSVYRI